MTKPQELFRPVMMFWLCALPVFAQPPSKPLTLDDCVRLAEAAQSSITIAKQQAEIARYGLTVARAGFLPQAAVSTAFNYNSPLPHKKVLDGHAAKYTSGYIGLQHHQPEDRIPKYPNQAALASGSGQCER